MHDCNTITISLDTPMKIAHVAIACFYIEGWGYQENLLPKYHRLAGHDVYMISSRFDKDQFNKPRLRPVSEYVNRDGIHVSILDYGTPSLLWKLLRQRPIKGLYRRLEEIGPDIIFVHGGNSIASLDIVRYKKRHPHVRLFADQHEDYYNAPVHTLKQWLIAKLLFGYMVRSLARHTEMYWGVTPWRVSYLRDVYGLRASQTDLLVMGADDELVDFRHRKDISRELRRENGISPDAFLIVTGGKIDRTKNIHLLMEAVSHVTRREDDIALVVYGSVDHELQSVFDDLLRQNPHIHFVGWLDNRAITRWMLAADLAVFPGTHSVLWETCVACGTPMIVKDWAGMHHVDLGGNCRFVQGSDLHELEDTLSRIVYDRSTYRSMQQVVQSDARKAFLYSHIALKSIGEDNAGAS